MDFDETWQEASPQHHLLSLVFFVPIGHSRWPPWPLIGWNIFRLLGNRWMDFDETWHEASPQRPLSSFCFCADRKSKNAALASDWLKHFSTSPQPLNGFWRNLTWSKSSAPSINFVFFVPIGNPRWPPWPLICWNIFRLLFHNRWMDFDETWQEASPQHHLSSLVFFVPIGNPRWPPWPLIGWNIFRLLHNRWMELTKLDKKQVLNALYQVCVFVPIVNPRWPPWPLIGWNIFRLLLHNRWMDFDETWQEASPQRPLSSLCFSCRSEIQDGRPGLWLTKTFFGFFSTTAEWISTKLDRKQVRNTLYIKFVFFAPIGNSRWQPWPLIGWNIFRLLFRNR